MAVELEDLKAMWLSLRAHVDQLASERQQYLDFFEQSQEAYIVTDPTGTVVDVNGAAVDVLQRRRRHLAGKPIAAMVALDRRLEFRSRMRRIADGEPGAVRTWNTVFESPGLCFSDLLECDIAVGHVCASCLPGNGRAGARMAASRS